MNSTAIPNVYILKMLFANIFSTTITTLPDCNSTITVNSGLLLYLSIYLSKEMYDYYSNNRDI